MCVAFRKSFEVPRKQALPRSLALTLRR
jgi:hypothetical protein